VIRWFPAFVLVSLYSDWLFWTSFPCLCPLSLVSFPSFLFPYFDRCALSGSHPRNVLLRWFYGLIYPWASPFQGVPSDWSNYGGVP